MALKILIVDDEFPARQEIKCLLEEIGNVEVVGECVHGQEALSFLAKNNKVDAVFLDIEMPLMDGLAAAEKINALPEPPKLVFSTGFSEFAVKAFELNGVDYILKPYTKERLEITLSRLTRDKENKDSEQSDIYNIGTLVNRFTLWHGERLLVLDPREEIMLVKAGKGKKTLFYTKRGIIESGMLLKDVEERLKNSAFLRIHKSYIVNMDKVREVLPWFNDTYLLVVEGCEKEEVPVSRHFMQEFKSLLYADGRVRK